jgi:hypothetical protein
VRALHPDRCLAHLDPAELAAALRGLCPGSALDLRGTRLDAGLLGAVVAAVTDAAGRPRFGAVDLRGAELAGDVDLVGAVFGGEARFDGARFEGEASFAGARFDGAARFVEAEFERAARFGAASFSGRAWFGGARFAGGADFGRVVSRGDTRFNGVRFEGPACFGGARFEGRAWFGGARFEGAARFGGASCAGEARFAGASFRRAGRLGPLVAAAVTLDRSTFARPVSVEVAAARLSCRQARFATGARLRLRFADLDLDGAAVAAPSSVAFAPEPFAAPGAGRPLDEAVARAAAVSQHPDSARSGGRADPAVPRLRSLRGVDAANLVVTDIDLSACRFAGALHLDRLRLEGRVRFATPPRRVWLGRGSPPVWRWSRRAVLADESAWRGRGDHARGWPVPPAGEPAIGPPAVAMLYRQLRGVGPGTLDADLYYGECDMRRHAARPRSAERSLLSVYWLCCGYGRRVTRAVASLLAVLAALLALQVLIGLPDLPPGPRPALAGARAAAVAAPAGLLHQSPLPAHVAGGLVARVASRWTRRRLAQAGRIELRAMLLRGTRQRLTGPGRFLEALARLLDPWLLAAVLHTLANRARALVR